MPPKKKSKPTFEVPEELQTAPQTGWVYRSEHESEAQADTIEEPKPAEFHEAAPAVIPPPPAPEPPPPAHKSGNGDASHHTSKSDMDLFDLAALTISSGFEAIGNAMILTTRIITAPFSMGMKMLGWK
jgi:hypothetical protein